MSTLWVGIDEAGYGPNLGPLVMSAVVVRSLDDRPPDLWADASGQVTRAGGDPRLLWVDDSKAVYRGGQGRERLEDACLATLLGAGVEPPGTLGALLETLGSGGLGGAELDPWLDAGDPPILWRTRAVSPFEGTAWRLVAVRTAVVGPARFNAGLRRHGSKAAVHFETFSRLLREVWELASDEEPVEVRCDKHGGRHFYYEPLLNAFPDSWIDRGDEGPLLSRYVIRREGRRLTLRLQPRADAEDGLVALASLVSKAVREWWMEVFNAHWLARVPGLKPTAGYPVDAARFRTVIGPLCEARGVSPDDWWRAK